MLSGGQDDFADPRGSPSKIGEPSFACTYSVLITASVGGEMCGGNLTNQVSDAVLSSSINRPLNRNGRHMIKYESEHMRPYFKTTFQSSNSFPSSHTSCTSLGLGYADQRIKYTSIRKRFACLFICLFIS